MSAPFLLEICVRLESENLFRGGRDMFFFRRNEDVYIIDIRND